MGEIYRQQIYEAQLLINKISIGLQSQDRSISGSEVPLIMLRVSSNSSVEFKLEEIPDLKVCSKIFAIKIVKNPQLTSWPSVNT